MAVSAAWRARRYWSSTALFVPLTLRISSATSVSGVCISGIDMIDPPHDHPALMTFTPRAWHRTMACARGEQRKISPAVMTTGDGLCNVSASEAFCGLPLGRQFWHTDQVAGAGRQIAGGRHPGTFGTCQWYKPLVLCHMTHAEAGGGAGSHHRLVAAAPARPPSRR